MEEQTNGLNKDASPLDSGLRVVYLRIVKSKIYGREMV